MSTTNVMTVAPQAAAQTKAPSSKPVAKTGKKTTASDDSFDDALGKASTDAKQSAADVAADAQDGAEDTGAKDDKTQTPLAAVLAALQQGNGNTAAQTETAQTQLGSDPAAVLTISTAGNGQTDAVQVKSAVQSNLQSLIPQSTEAGLKNQDFLAMLSGQQLKAASQSMQSAGVSIQSQAQTPVQPALQNTTLQAAVLTETANAQNAGQQAAAGTVLEAQLANSQTAAGNLQNNNLQGMMVQNTAAANQQPAVQTAQVTVAAQSAATTLASAQSATGQTAAQLTTGQAKDSATTKSASSLLDGAALSVEDRTQAAPLRMDAQQALNQQHTSSGQQNAAGQNQSQPDTGDSGVQLMQQLPEEAAADRTAPTQKTTDSTANTQVSMFQQGLQDSIKGTGTANQVQAGQQTQTDYDIPRQIVDQARLIRTNENTEMVIKLNPDHLGDLTLKVSVSQNGSVNASFHSDNAQVRTVIENSLVQLRQELNNQGIKVDSVEVYAGLADGQLPQDQGQQAWQNQQGSSNTSVRGVQMGSDDYVEEAESLSAAVQTRENTAMEGVDYRI